MDVEGDDATAGGGDGDDGDDGDGARVHRKDSRPAMSMSMSMSMDVDEREQQEAESSRHVSFLFEALEVRAFDVPSLPRVPWFVCACACVCCAALRNRAGGSTRLGYRSA